MGHKEGATCPRGKHQNTCKVGAVVFPELSFRAQPQRSHPISGPRPSAPAVSGCGARLTGVLRDGGAGAAGQAQLGCKKTWFCVYQHRAQRYQATPFLLLWAPRLHCKSKLYQLRSEVPLAMRCDPAHPSRKCRGCRVALVPLPNPQAPSPFYSLGTLYS